MSIDVYWAYIGKDWMIAEEPEKVSSRFYNNYSMEKGNEHSMINYCPAFNGAMKNTFALKSVYDYNFTIDSEKITSSLYDAEYFNRHILVRSEKQRFFSYNGNQYIFFAKEDLEVDFYLYPWFENNTITQRCMIPPGKFNIGKWFRNTEFSFFLKKEFDTFEIHRGDVYSYIKFNTEETVKFKQFRYTDKLSNFLMDGVTLNKFKLGTLKNYYRLFKTKKLILSEIERNLL